VARTAGNLHFYDVNVDEAEGVEDVADIHQVPSYVYYRGGNRVFAAPDITGLRDFLNL
jgi:hypothetical protein